MRVEITAIGCVVLPLTLLVLLLRPRLLLCWALFLSVFQAAAAVVIQLGPHYPLGIAPAFMVAPLAILSYFLARRPEEWMPRSLRWLCLPLWLFVGYALVSAVAAPRFFEGLIVASPRGSLLQLQLSLTNLSAATYLLCCSAFLFAVMGAVAGEHENRIRESLIRWFLCGVSFAGLVGFYQFFGRHWGLPYPHRFFNSNVAYSQRFADRVADYSRFTGTFTEASIAAWFFGAATVYALWQVLFARCRGFELVVLAICCPALLLTTSSTGYLILVGIALIVPLRLLWLRRLTARTAGALMALIAGLVGAAAWALRDARLVQHLLDLLLLRKEHTRSFLTRSLNNHYAWHTFVATHGLGSGWGSLRASSLTFTLVGSVGAIGLALAVWFGLRLARKEWCICSLAQMRFPQREGLIAALAAMLGAGFISVTDMVTYLPFWAFVGIYVAMAWQQAQRRRLGPPSHLAIPVRAPQLQTRA